jgi:hypothetical protein
MILLLETGLPGVSHFSGPAQVMADIQAATLTFIDRRHSQDASLRGVHADQRHTRLGGYS